MSCSRDAAFSKRISEEAGVEVIGGADKYMAVCRQCYFSPNKVLTLLLQCCAVLCCAVQCSASVQCLSAMQCSGVQCSAVQCLCRWPHRLELP